MPEQTVTIKALLQDKITGGLAAIGRGFKSLKADVANIGQSLSPITGKIAGAAAAFVSFQAVKSALQQGEEAAAAQRRLFEALRGNAGEIERLGNVADKLGAKFAIDNDEISNMAATLLNLGVASQDVDKALEAAIRTASATGQSIEGVITSIGRFGEEGAGRLAIAVPELQKLQEEGKLAAEGVDLLLKKFASSGEATDDFKDATGLTHKLNDALEDQGKEFVKVKVSLLQGLIPAVKQLTEFLQSDTGKGILSVIGAIAKEAAPFLTTVAGIVVGLNVIKGVLFVIGPVVTALTSPWFLIAAAVIAIGVAIAEHFGILGKVREFVGNIVARVRAWFAEVAKGNTSIEDLFDVLKTRLAQGAIALKNFFVDRFINYLVATKDLFVGLFNYVVGKLQSIGGSFAEFIGAPFDAVIRGIAKSIDFVTNKLADGIQRASDFLGIDASALDRIRTNLEGSLPKGSIGKAIKDAGDELAAKGFDQFSNAFTRAREADVQDAVEGAQKIAKLEDELAARAAARQAERSKTKAAVEDKEAADAARREAQRIDTEAGLLARLDEIRTQKNHESDESIRAQRLEDLDRAFDDEKKSIEKRFAAGKLTRERAQAEELTAIDRFARDREAIEAEPIKKQIEARQKEAAALEAVIAKIREEKGANADVQSQLEQLVAVRLKEQSAVFALAALIRKVAEARKAEADRATADARKRAEDRAKEIAEEIKALRSGFDARRTELRSKASEGFLFQDDAIELERRAVANYTTAFNQLHDEFEKIIQTNPDLAQSLADVRKEIGKLSDAADRARTQVLPDFFRGFEAGAVGAIKKGADLRESGIQVGEAFANAAGDIAVGFTEADFSFSNFAGNFLRTIGQMLIKLAVFRALAGAFGLNITQGLNRGGPVLAFDGGGPVPGPRVHRDVVDAKLTPGEWVMRESAVNHYGEAFMAALNHRLIPRDVARGLSTPARATNLSRHFAEGGSVGPGGSGGGGGPVMATIIASEQEADRLHAASPRAFVRAVEANAGAIRGVLRIQTGF